MKRRIAVAATATLCILGNAKSQDTLVSAFFGLDNALAGLLCNQPGSLLDGMPVNFQFPLDASSLSETHFEVLDELGNVHAPICALLASMGCQNCSPASQTWVKQQLSVSPRQDRSRTP